MKKCSSCKEHKSLSEFFKHKNIKGGYRYQCKQCESIAYNKRRDHHTARKRKWYIENTYNMSYEEYETLRILQDDKCFICKADSNDLHIDHCHDTGEVRALLCSRCNTLLGRIENAPVDIEEYFKYLGTWVGE